MGIKTNDELYRYLNENESRHLEFKAASKQFDFTKLLQYCCAFSCEGGGEIVFGVSDDKRIVGTQAFEDYPRAEKRIYDELGIRCVFDEKVVESKRVLILHIPRSIPGRPTMYNGQYWMRNGESLQPMSQDRLRVLLNEVVPDWLDENEPGMYSWDEVQTLLAVEKYYDLLGVPVPNTSTKIDDFIRLKFVERSWRDPDKFYIRRLGALVLARDLDKFQDVRYRKIRVIQLRGSDITHAISDRYFSAGYAVVFAEALSYINALIPAREVFDDGLRHIIKDFPDVAIREILANACVHQDFYSNGDVAVTIADDYISVVNPGIPEISTNRFVDEAYERNESLAEVLRILRICEKRGSGIDRALENIESEKRNAPEFLIKEKSTEVRLTKSHFGDMSIQERINAVYLHCCLRAEKNEYLTNGSLRERFGLPKNKAAQISQLIAQAADKGLIVQDPSTRGAKRTARYRPFYYYEPGTTDFI
ncbi:RNA-binding domain-containing protein [Alloscardovia macacae]|uniref:Divergent AAA domain-containing protein n=1 Tax=Alloscardovia macacae TaxID=1160091 RepID=A0A261F4S2_9BIFI|nr:RNA-binding domain-containing protein [Alloscardovia macacae]OZG54075.1 Divergent AAA domain-containing protein [Alloscardovia macacae]